MKTLILSITLFFIQLNCFALDEIPSKKNLLKILDSNPNSKSLWAAYIGKSWACMSKKEIALIKKMRLSIINKNASNQVGLASISIKDESSNADMLNSSLNKLQEDLRDYMTVEEYEKEKKEWDFLISQSELTLEENKSKKHDLLVHLNKMEKSMTNIPSYITSLSDNLNKNFAVVEDELMQEFSSLDSEYTYYSDVKQKSKLSQERWIQLNIEKLKKLKRVQFLSIRNQIVKETFNITSI